MITSNFEKVRFYIHNAVEFEEFNLFRLTYEHFQLMWLCLAKENLLRGIPLQIKKASILQEENVTKQIRRNELNSCFYFNRSNVNGIQLPDLVFSDSDWEELNLIFNKLQPSLKIDFKLIPDNRIAADYKK